MHLLDKFLGQQQVENHLKKNEQQINKAVEKMKIRHPHELWFERYDSPLGYKVSRYDKEFVLWMEEVYFDNEGFYLDKEISFYESRINKFEKELNIPQKNFEFKECLLKDLPYVFNKERRTITRTIAKMRENNGQEFEYKKDDGLIVITSDGIKWLVKNCFKKVYLEILEKYKRDLQDGKVVR